MKSELFVGITTWNDSNTLQCCLEALQKTLKDVDYQLYITDNESEDDTVDIARQYTEGVRVKREYQAEALNYLVSKSRGRHSLFIHSDVIMLGRDWYTRCKSYLDAGSVLVSPEDIGCGNFTRPFGKGMPESSFMLFNTKWLKRTRRLNLRKTAKWALGKRSRWGYEFDFYGEHITHNIPEMVRSSGETWEMMNVYPSNRNDYLVHLSEDSGKLDGDEAYRTYGFGNFYGLDGEITHYHNWFARWEELYGKETSKWGIPASMIKSYSMKFLEDYRNDSVELPVCAGRSK